jgi:Orn/Lys/Arg decarboxylase, C-terminal domain
MSNDVEHVSVDEIANRTAANGVMPYPPSIPMLMSGENFGGWRRLEHWARRGGPAFVHYANSGAARGQRSISRVEGRRSAGLWPTSVGAVLRARAFRYIRSNLSNALAQLGEFGIVHAVDVNASSPEFSEDLFTQVSPERIDFFRRLPSFGHDARWGIATGPYWGKGFHYENVTLANERTDWFS